MEWMHIVIITLMKLLLSNSEHILNSKFKDTTRFRCITEKGHNFTERIRMYLYLEKLEIICNLYHVDNIEGGVMNILSPLYTSLGLTPSLEIFNRTSLIAFKFERSLVRNKAAWHLTIPRERIIIPTDIFPADEWYVRFKLHYGTRLFSTEGTLLDVVREPLLQWELGVQVEVADIFPILQLAHTLIIVRRLCASDMAIIAPVFTSHELPNAGVYLLVTKSAFKAENDKWYDVKPKLCALLNGGCVLGSSSLLPMETSSQAQSLLLNRRIFLLMNI
ncbi:cation channel sperm-associated protein subunit beta-like isoform X2 [Chiloscyllium plagiosum]|uniref:cation channel sperm-associated protein subunit beta-like isoform X2 n=1 Tax=Chiloscyllium plagiosum TaxID=36176 RepID=UPI001CB7FA57|nr:cation channel sperm-associated protein subunit beta-like isoform X2 [Chiloscyllium plagiosum]